MSDTTYKAIDLFAGIGGIRMGFDQAFGKKIETVFVSEFDEPAQKTYRANFDDPFDISGDITQIEASQVPDFDICLAGFPCQAFSLAGKRKGFDDDYKGRARGTLFFDMLRICTDRDAYRHPRCGLPRFARNAYRKRAVHAGIGHQRFQTRPATSLKWAFVREQVRLPRARTV